MRSKTCWGMFPSVRLEASLAERQFRAITEPCVSVSSPPQLPSPRAQGSAHRPQSSNDFATPTSTSALLRPRPCQAPHTMAGPPPATNALSSTAGRPPRAPYWRRKETRTPEPHRWLPAAHPVAWAEPPGWHNTGGRRPKESRGLLHVTSAPLEPLRRRSSALGLLGRCGEAQRPLEHRYASLKRQPPTEGDGGCDEVLGQYSKANLWARTQIAPKNTRRLLHGARRRNFTASAGRCRQRLPMLCPMLAKVHAAAISAEFRRTCSKSTCRRIPSIYNLLLGVLQQFRVLRSRCRIVAFE